MYLIIPLTKVMPWSIIFFFFRENHIKGNHWYSEMFSGRGIMLVSGDMK